MALVYGSPSVCAPFFPNTSWADEMDKEDELLRSTSNDNLVSAEASKKSNETSDSEGSYVTDEEDKDSEIMDNDSSDSSEISQRGAGELTPKRKTSTSFTPRRMKLSEIYPVQRGVDPSFKSSQDFSSTPKIMVKEHIDFPDCPPYTAFVSNMHLDTTKDDLFRHFGTYGRIVKLKIIFDRETNRSKGFCYIEYQHPESLRNSLKANSTTLRGKDLIVVVADKEKKKEYPSNGEKKSSYSDVSPMKKYNSFDHSGSRDYAASKGKHSSSSIPNMRAPSSFSSTPTHEYKPKYPAKVNSSSNVGKEQKREESISPSKPSQGYSGAFRHMNAPKKSADEAKKRVSVTTMSNAFSALSTEDEN